MTKTKYKIRPAGRHLITIGSDLIHDKYAAVIELVKNAYDADSPDAVITFKKNNDKHKFTLIVEDHGHGMTRDVVINQWLVPSTDDKLQRKLSSGGRVMQGRKGIGRYAASMLGSELLLQTVTATGEETQVMLEWEKFNKAEFLDDVDVTVSTDKTGKLKGTKLIINGGAEYLADWDDNQLEKLEYELKKLIPPVMTKKNKRIKKEFTISISFENFYEESEKNTIHEIKPFPVFDLYDYRIAGDINAAGKAKIIFHNNKIRNAVKEKIALDQDNNKNCGNIRFDIRVYDREKESMDALIKKGFKDAAGNYVEKLEARRILNESCGIGVYRNGFRIRPLGDADFDWLELNRKRVQNPSLQIGSNQVIGYILIESEEQSGLEEKSARDGLKNNLAYKILKERISRVIRELENRRFVYRKSAGLSRKTPKGKIEVSIKKLYEFDDIKQTIKTKLKQANVDEKVTDNIIGVIEKKEASSNQIAEEIRKSVAVYQGQATLGKIINVILHEGRKPLSFFKNQIPNINFWYDEFSRLKDTESLNELLSITGSVGKNAEIFVSLFGKLDPLSAAERGLKKEFKLIKPLKESFLIFEDALNRNHIEHNINCEENVSLYGWDQDVYFIFTNLIDNSIFWITEKKSKERLINVTVQTENNKLVYIDYKDTGPGIEQYLIDSEVIFEPEFTTKPQKGSGLGLAIAGEAAQRNLLELKAFYSETGAYFRLQIREADK